MLRVRFASASDSEDIFEWRNHETTRQMSHDTDPVGWRSHCEWLESTLDDANRYLLICTTSEGAGKVAVVRFDIRDNTGTISINLSPAMRGKGLAKACLMDSISYLKSIRNSVSVIKAEIKTKNLASRKVFERAGFSMYDEINDVAYYKLELPRAE